MVRLKPRYGYFGGTLIHRKIAVAGVVLLVAWCFVRRGPQTASVADRSPSDGRRDPPVGPTVEVSDGNRVQGARRSATVPSPPTESAPPPLPTTTGQFNGSDGATQGLGFLVAPVEPHGTSQNAR